MRKIQLSIVAVASIVGVGTAFAFKPGKAFAPVVYGIKNTATGTYSYTSVKPTTPLSCQLSTESCTITTTIPLATLNSPTQPYRTTFPAESPSPYVNWISPVNSIYK